MQTMVSHKMSVAVNNYFSAVSPEPATRLNSEPARCRLIVLREIESQIPW